jgi:hypothetical protein
MNLHNPHVWIFNAQIELDYERAQGEITKEKVRQYELMKLNRNQTYQAKMLTDMQALHTRDPDNPLYDLLVMESEQKAESNAFTKTVAQTATKHSMDATKQAVAAYNEYTRKAREFLCEHGLEGDVTVAMLCDQDRLDSFLVELYERAFMEYTKFSQYRTRVRKGQAVGSLVNEKKDGKQLALIEGGLLEKIARINRIVEHFPESKENLKRVMQTRNAVNMLLEYGAYMSFAPIAGGDMMASAATTSLISNIAHTPVTGTTAAKVIGGCRKLVRLSCKGGLELRKNFKDMRMSDVGVYLWWPH